MKRSTSYKNLFSRWLGQKDAPPPDEGQSEAQKSTADLSRLVIIPTCEWSKDQKLCSTLIDETQYQMRQDNIDRVLARIEQSAHSNEITASGQICADSLMLGARIDLVSAAELTAQRFLPLSQFQGVRDLENIMRDYPDHKTTPALLWLALNDVERTYLHYAPHLCQSACATILERMCIERLELHPKSGLHLPTALALLEYYLKRAQMEQATSLALDIITQLPRALMVMGRVAMMRARLEEHAKHRATPFDLTSRRMAAASYGAIGHSAYAWMYLEGLLTAPSLSAELDLDFFEDGLRDLMTHFPDQGTCNRLISRLYIGADVIGTSAKATASVAQQLRELGKNLMRTKLHELHPLIWAETTQQASELPQTSRTSNLVSIGYDIAMERLVRDFSGPLSSGHAVVFTKNGVDLIAQRL